MGKDVEGRASDEKDLRRRILELVAEYYRQAHAPRPFAPGETRVNYASRVYDERELMAAVGACLDFWLSAGPNAGMFERRLAETIGVNHALVVNSGSSANLVAVGTLLSRRLERPLEPGDEVIAPAMGFPTSVAPIVQNGLTPVFVDCELGTYNLDPGQLEPALSERTRALCFAHMLGNPVEMEQVVAFARAHDLYVIEDACDALGSVYDGRMVGSFGDLATLSFYPAHHITSLDSDEPIMVMGPSGTIKILKIGDFVENCSPFGWKCIAFDRQGHLDFRDITGVVKHPVQEKLYRVTARTGRQAVVSASHSLFTVRDGEILTVKVSDLVLGDYVLVPNSLPNVETTREVAYTTYKRGSWEPVQISVPLSCELSEVLGYFVAEGSFDKTDRGYYVRYTFSVNEADIAERVKDLVKSLFDVRAFVYRRPNGSTIDVVASSKALYQFLETHCGMGAKNKRVPDFIFTAPSEMKWAFLKAYFIGDGCEHETKGKHKGFSYDSVTVSKDLALGVHYLLLQLGINSRFSVKSRASVRDFGKYRSKTRLSYAVCYSKKSVVSAGGFRGGGGTGRKIGNLSLVKITKIEQVQPSSEFVYDLEVKGHENFIGGIGMCLHNTGEGGAVLTDDPQLARIAQSLRDWGRDCRCAHDSPPEGACGRRFEWQIPGLDEPYDHRYLYSEIGYNLKMTDIQAAIGLAQLDKLPEFVAARKRNFARLYEALKPHEEFLILPAWSERADPAWFAFPISVRPGAPFTRRDLTNWLEGRNIETRFLFAGNITRQPGYRHIPHRTVGDLPNSDLVMRSTFFVGVYPGLDEARLAYILEAFDDFFCKFVHS